MLKKTLTLAFSAALAVFASAWLAGAAQAGPTAVCGDGVIEGAEECDDNNTVPDDTCSFPSCLPRVCGDGTPNPDPGTDEECDDGNVTDDDGCTDTCQDDCGDTETDAGLGETCDEGNDTNGDGCDDDITTTPPGNCTITACGNGVITAPETCDPPDADCDALCQTIDDTPLEKGQQGCVNAINKNLAGVLKAQGADNAKCVKDVSGAKVASIDDCLGDDVDGKVAKAAAKTTKTATGKKCIAANVPGFAFTDAATVNGTTAEVQEAVTTVFGAAPTIVLKSADAAGAGCQAEVLKQLNAVMGKYSGEANKAKKSTLKGGKGGTPPPAGGAGALGTGIDTAVAASTAIAKAESKANTGIAKKCQDDAAVDALFDCGGATTVNAVTLCTIAAAKEAACNALEVADDITLTCPSELIP